MSQVQTSKEEDIENKETRKKVNIYLKNVLKLQ